MDFSKVDLSSITGYEGYEPENTKTVFTKDISALVAYMIGIREDVMEQQYPDVEIWKNVVDDPNINIIRYLSIFRTTIMKFHGKIDYELRYNMKNLDEQEFFSKEDIEKAKSLGIQFIQTNYTASKYLCDFCRMISANIDKCRKTFPSWVKWEYIRDLFVFPKWNKPDALKTERIKYKENFQSYPYQMYIHWKPEEAGNLISHDKKLLTILYKQHGDTFTDYTKLRDASSTTKNSIYSFIESAARVSIAVDCENVDPFKLYSALKSLNEESIGKIEKIALYDDVNTTVAWDYLAKYLHIPVEHVEVERVVNHKSLVDMKLAVSVCRDYFINGITSFILISSDSDFWGLISGMPEAEFLVMFEYDKCGQAIRDALNDNKIYNCSLDDFISTNADELKRLVLFNELNNYLPSLWGLNPMELTKELFDKTKISATQKELETFCDKYVKTLKLQISNEGSFEVVIKK